LVEDASGNWWLVFLGIRENPAPNLGRETHLAPVAWVNDWPVVNGGKLITLTMPGDRLPAGQPWPQPRVRDEFDSATPGLEWNFFRNPSSESWSLKESPGALVLKSTGEDLSSVKQVAYLGRRLRAKECRFAASVSATPAKAQAAGISLFSKQDAYLEMVLCPGPNGREVLLRRREGAALQSLAALATPGDAPVQLEWVVQAGDIFSRVSLDDGKTWQTIHKGKIGKLVPYPGFAGLYFGMQATGPGTKAVFDWSEYEDLQQPLVISQTDPPLRELTLDEVRGFQLSKPNDGRIEVESGVLNGPQIENEQVGVCSVGFIKNGATLELKGVTARELAKTVTACVSCGGPGGVIEVWAGGTAGKLIAKIEVGNTGGWKNWKEVAAPVSEWKPGKYDLTLVFRGNGDFLLNLDWIRFDSDKGMAVNQ
jgi:hypothetical protein